jgi:hypothetical protein
MTTTGTTKAVTRVTFLNDFPVTEVSTKAPTSSPEKGNHTVSLVTVNAEYAIISRYKKNSGTIALFK